MMDVIQEIANWFESCCDGQWEHAHGIKIESTDNPGWWIRIDVAGTSLVEKTFNPIERGDVGSNDPQPPWLRCHVDGTVFEGAGDPHNLNEILRIFLEWARR
jgi:hypothetical protein